MHENGMGLDLQHPAVMGGDGAVTKQPSDTGEHGGIVLDDGTGLAARHQLAVGLIGAVGQKQVEGAQSRAPRRRLQFGMRQHQQCEIAVKAPRRPNQRFCHIPVGAGKVAERAMRIQMRDLAPLRPRQRLQCADLVEDMAFQLVRAHRYGPATKPVEVGKADMRAKIDAAGLG